MQTAFLPTQPVHALLSSSSFTSSPASVRRQHQYALARLQTRRPGKSRSVQMIDQNTILAVIAGAAGLGGGVALVAWTENQGKRTDTRQNTQPCFECKGETITVCNVCEGSTKSPIDPEQPCTYCEGAGSVTCLNCAGTGIQPRFLDRLSPEDFMD